MTSPFHPGQRWISTSEPELGLGQIVAITARSVRVAFPATGDTREYALQNAPLRRAAFRVGDTITTTTRDDFRIDEVVERDGLLHYRAATRDIPETALAHTLGFGSPTERLFAGVFDPPSVFELRRSALQHEHRRRQSPVRGFLGGRIELLPHQISIASEVCSRVIPRVLLADEVGLGKTIEACLILHRLLLTGRAQRVLIVVQESLIHQWFVELLRRFNTWCHIFDEARCQAIEEGTPEANPFLEQQLVLCDIGLLTREIRLEQAVAAGWDLVIVDEAHHLQWTRESASREYSAIETLGHSVPGLLLLTATPEQLGLAGHFARLRLLDPDRFHDFDAFVTESHDYAAVARLAERLRQRLPLAPADAAALAQRLTMPLPELRADLEAIANGDDRASSRLIERLLDQHGTGRVVFRNTRATVSGFPPRLPQLHPLAADADDTARRKALSREWQADVEPAHDTTRPAFKSDPRLLWLAAWLRTIAPDKVLLICRSQAKALAIEDALKQHSQIKAGAFHEGLTLVQRDRAAAWFAEPDGARLLICSEIGSEGRNFQFAHHLVLFDLPLDPAVLEQRIGRLDRIGQRHDVQIHVPFVQQSHQEVLARWYHEGLDAFASNVQGGRELFERFGSRLYDLAGRAGTGRGVLDSELETFIADTRRAYVDIGRSLEEGRDRLLEWHSFKPEIAAAVISAIRDEDDSLALDAFLLAVLDLYVIDVEELSPRTYRLGSAGVLVDDFPGLTSDRVTVTGDRARALNREDLQFLTWDHPLATGALDLLLGSEHGNCSFGRWTDGGVQEIYLEAIYVLECVAPARLHADRFLPPTPLRVIVDRRGTSVADNISSALLNERLKKGDGGRGLAGNPRVRDELLPRLMERTRELAQQASGAVVADARRTAAATLEHEATRLRELQKVNRSVRDEEIAALVEQRRVLEDYVGAARIRLDAVRLIYRGRG